MDNCHFLPRTWLRDAILVVLVTISWAIVPSFGAGIVTEDSVRAAYLYRFAGYIDWPPEDAARQGFTIDVLGSPGTASELRRLLADHSIKNRTAIVREISSLQELGDAQILFLGAGNADMIRGLAPRPGVSAVLIVTNEDGALASGSTINFVHIERNIRFEVSMAAAQRWGLRISSELLSVAVRVQSASPRSAMACPHPIDEALIVAPCRGSRGSP
jgi:YfiR/HmsC-like